MQQSPATPNPHKPRCRDWVAEDCCIPSLLLAVPSCIYSFWHGVIPTSYFIFILVSLIFILSLDCSARRDDITPTYVVRATRTYTRMRIVRVTEVVTFTCSQDKNGVGLRRKSQYDGPGFCFLKVRRYHTRVSDR